jgi:hypothetical protein
MARARQVGALMAAEDGVGTACDAIEALLARLATGPAA